MICSRHAEGQQKHSKLAWYVLYIAQYPLAHANFFAGWGLLSPFNRPYGKHGRVARSTYPLLNWATFSHVVGRASAYTVHSSGARKEPCKCIQYSPRDVLTGKRYTQSNEQTNATERITSVLEVMTKTTPCRPDGLRRREYRIFRASNDTVVAISDQEQTAPYRTVIPHAIAQAKTL